MDKNKMAAAGNSGSLTTTLMQRIDGELICGICLELFKSPVMLLCGHNFCKECVYGMIENGMSFSFISIGPPRSFNCPICQKAIDINIVTHNGLLSNKALESIVELYKTCSPVDVFDSSWNADIEMMPTMCKMHNKPEDRFCDSCNVSICAQCERVSHQTYKAKHRVSSLKHAAISYQTEVADVLTKLKKELIPLNDKINQLENILGGIQGKQEHINKSLDEQISLLMSVIRQQQEQLKSTLDTKMHTQQEPVIAELDKCRAVKTNVQELMKKLSNIRNTRNPTLQLKLMKDTCVQLRTVLSFDISERLGIFHSSDTVADEPTWNLDTREIINSISELDWQHEISGPVKSDSKDTGIQTDAIKPSENDVKNKNRKVGKRKNSPLADRYDLGLRPLGSRSHGSRSPDDRRSDRGAFDEIDGDYPDVSKEVDHDVKSFRVKEIDFDENKNKTNCVKEVKLKHASDKVPVISIEEDLNEKFETLKLENRLKSKGRSSFPMESSPHLNDRKVSERTQSPPMKSKKSYSDKDLNKGDRSESRSPSNAEALAKFVARRRTMSPSVSSPSLKTLEYSSSKNEVSEIISRKNTSSPALKSLSGTFLETNDKNDEDFTATTQSEKDRLKSPVSKDEKENITKIAITNEKDLVGAKSMEELPNDTSEKNRDNDQGIHVTKEPITQTETGSVKDDDVSHQPKPFLKQPIGMKLDLHLAHHNEESSKDDSKKVTQV